jgi:hypothetical protein
MKYDQVFDGDWIKPLMSGWRMKCCSCSLIHIIKFKVERHGKRNTVLLRARVCKRATAAARRRKS